MTLRIVAGWLRMIGAVAIIAAIGWWAMLFPGVIDNTGLTFKEAFPCIALSSGSCLLQSAICGGRHLFGIQHYSPDLFWCGVAVASASLLITNVFLPSNDNISAASMDG
ncbi:hypothetical protein [Bradyrhizobium uaiense]|uniref:Uncharacterized protein n=1 Tax=Bradyrhizobium uaiense TaxID=2594946 RepID=A0A6P1BL21_9BRAD|nr:hypothetical protein [Bradyrhizobium uaiense]NEU98330.1 hypothetical protein [Bradyrhizobium uaiense]